MVPWQKNFFFLTGHFNNLLETLPMKTRKDRISPPAIKAVGDTVKELIIEGEINISEDVIEWIVEHYNAGRHISVLSFETKGGRIKLTLADSQQVRLVHELIIKTAEMQARLKTEPPIDDFREPPEPNKNVSK